MTATNATLLDELIPLAPDARLDRVRAMGRMSDVLAELVEAASRLTATETARADEATALVVDLADRANDPTARARSRRARARSLSYSGRYAEALAVCEEAVEVARGAEDRIEVGRALLASMHALTELGRIGEAIHAGERAREILAGADQPALAARADINLSIAHQRRDEPHAALEHLERARPLLAGEPLTLGHLDNSRGEALLAINDFQGAESAFASALAAFESAGAPLTAAIAESNLADLAARGGRLHPALEHFERARRKLEASGASSHLARLLAEQAEAKAMLGLLEDARSEYEEALRALDGAGLALEAARARCGLGLALLRLDRLAEASTALAAAATGFEELGHATARAKVDLARCELALRHGRFAEGRRLATAALAQLHDRPADAAVARHALGRAAYGSGDLETALADLGAGLAAARAHNIAPLLADLLESRGLVHRSAARLDAAIADWTEALLHIERVRGSLQANRFRAAFLGDRSRSHALLVGAYLARGQAGDAASAFDVAQRAKSRTLLDETLRAHDAEEDGDGLVEGGGDLDVTRLRHTLARTRSDLDALYSRLASGGSDVALDAAALERWEGAVSRREQDLALLESRLEATGAAEWLRAEPARLADVQAGLREGDALVEWFCVEGRMIGFVVRGDGVEVAGDVALGAVEDALAAARFQFERALRPGAAQGPRRAQLLGDAQRSLERLDDVLLAPLRQRFAGAKRLIIAPHGPLHAVPFHACRHDDRALVEAHALTIAPSASLLVRLREAALRERASAARDALVVAVDDERAPCIAEEARVIGDLLRLPSERRLVGPAATRAAVRAASAGAAVLHLACHGRFLPENPLGSGLKLHDGWLTARDIGALRLDGAAVVLSGCETGLSRVSAGDEHAGLLPSFLAAGARALLVSLWRVDDEHTLDFMAALHAEWIRGCGSDLPLDRALHVARCERLAQGVHPAFWAPFVLVGEA